MTATRSQSDSAQQNSPQLPQHAAPLTPGSDNGHIPQSPDASAQPNNRRYKGRARRRIQNHPEWSPYLAARHILEPAITAEAWVEREEWTGQDVLVWQTKRRDGSQGATRRRLLKTCKVKGKRQAKLRWQFGGQKTDEPFYYVGTLDDLKREIARAGGKVYIVEGEFDVWSLHRLGIRNVIGIYGISNIPKDIAAIFLELGVASFMYLADNDAAGEKGGANLRTLLHASDWKGEGDYRRVSGAGIPAKGDANDLLGHHFPNIAAARAALEALPRFEPPLKRKRTAKPAVTAKGNEEGWEAVKEAIRIMLGIEPGDFKPNGYSHDRCCIIKEHKGDKERPSAAWHRNGHFKCFKCHGPGESLNTIETAERLGIDWRAILASQRSDISATSIDLDAAPQPINSERAPLALDEAPDTWLTLILKFYTLTAATLFLFALRLYRTGPLAQGFTRDEFVTAARPLGCNLKEDTIKKFFKEEVFKEDDHPVFAKFDPSDRSSIRTCKFRLRSPDDIQRRLQQGISYRVYEKTFSQHGDVLIDYQVFDEALLGSKFAKTLQSALAPLYREQKQRFASLKYACERKIAAYLADLDDLSATALPDWTIDKPCELTALLARGIYDADPEDRSKREWSRLLGISDGSVDAVVNRAGIQRHPYKQQEPVNSQRQAKDRARELGAKILAVEVDGAHVDYDAAMEISEGSVMIVQPTARHEIVSDEKQIIKAAPAKATAAPTAETAAKRAGNMKKPGNWHKPTWDPQFIYWELVKACCLLHGYAVIDDIGIADTQTGEVWTNPTLDELVWLITGQPADAQPAEP